MKINNISAFLALLRAGLWEKEALLLPYGKIDFTRVLSLAKEQSVIGLVTAGVEHIKDEKVPQELVLQLIGSTLHIEQQNVAMNAFIEELVTNLRNEGIYTVLVKGQGVAQCYERPLWRLSGDIDLFFSNENYIQAKEYLLATSEVVEEEIKTEKHIGFVKDSWIVELHGRLHCGLSQRIEKALDQVYCDTFYNGNVRSWVNGKTQVFLLSIENDIFYVFTHILQHFYKGGIGLRQVCDWCRLLWTYRGNVDLRVLEAKVTCAGIMMEWKAFGVFAVEYLGMPVEAMPFYTSSAKLSRKALKICKFIMKTGNFGHNRDMSYYKKYPYLFRKCMSFGRRVGDLCQHARIFPTDTLLFSLTIMFNGLRSAIKGE